MKCFYRPDFVQWILLALLTASPASGQKHAIHLSAPVHTGQKFEVTSNGSISMKALAGDTVIKSADYQVSFDGGAEVLEIDGKGQAVKIAYTVEKFSKTEGGATSVLLKPGSVIIDDGNQTPGVSLKDGTLEDPAREAFGLIFSKHKSGDVTDDEIFGAGQPKAIGETWPMNAAAASESLKSSGVLVPEGQLSGTVSLIAQEKIGAQDCLSLRGQIRADRVSMKDLPPGFTTVAGNVQAAFRGCFPLDEAGQSRREGVDMAMEMHLSGTDGVQIAVTNHQKTDRVWKAGN